MSRSEPGAFRYTRIGTPASTAATSSNGPHAVIAAMISWRDGIGPSFRLWRHRGPISARVKAGLASKRQGETAVDRIGLAGDPGARVRGQEQDHVGDVGRLARAADDVALELPLHPLR